MFDWEVRGTKLPSNGLWLNASKSESNPESITLVSGMYIVYSIVVWVHNWTIWANWSEVAKFFITVFYLGMSRTQDNLQMTFINQSVVISRAVTILRSNETYLWIGCLLLAMAVVTRVAPPAFGLGCDRRRVLQWYLRPVGMVAPMCAAQLTLCRPSFCYTHTFDVELATLLNRRVTPLVDSIEQSIYVHCENLC